MREALWITCLLALLMVCLLPAGALALPVLRRKLGRRGLGAFADTAAWRAAMERRAASLLRRMPLFPEEETFVYRLAARRRGVSRTKRSGRRAAKLLLAAGLYAEQNPVLFQAGKDYIAALFTPNGEWAVPMEQAEDALLAYAVLSYPGTDLHLVRPAMDQTARLLQALAGEADTIPAGRDHPALRLAQTLGAVCPFLAAYAAAYGEPFYLNLAMRQINEYLLNGMHPVQGIPAQGFDRNSGLPVGAFGWSGACAALAFGLMETDRYLPENDARKVRLQVHKRMLANRLRAMWAEDGSFPRLPAAQLPDSEAAAVLAAFLWDVCAKTQDQNGAGCIQNALNDLKSRTRLSGMVDFAQPESLHPGFYWDTSSPSSGALAAALFAAERIKVWGETLQAD